MQRMALQTVAETSVFVKCAASIWTDSELLELKTWLAATPDAGDVIPGSGGVRKVRWTRAGMGKRGGARVIYFNQHGGVIWLLFAYTKAKFDNLPAEFLAQLKKEVQANEKGS